MKKIEAIVRLSQFDSVRDALAGIGVKFFTGRTGEVGDGKITVLNVDSVTRVRTGEKGAEAL